VFEGQKELIATTTATATARRRDKALVSFIAYGYAENFVPHYN